MVFFKLDPPPLKITSFFETTESKNSQEFLFSTSPSPLGVGETSFFLNEAIRGEFSARKGKRYGIRGEFSARNGKRYEFEASFRREKVNNMIQDTSFFNKKREKQGKNWKYWEKKTGKKQEKNGKLPEIQKRDFDEVPGNAEKGNKFGNELGNEFGNEFGNKFVVFSNVTKRRFEGKNDSSSHPYSPLKQQSPRNSWTLLFQKTCDFEGGSS